MWKRKEESESVILGQLRRLGASCDWSRSRFTMDEGLSRAVVKVFVQLHRDGLIYRDKRLVNWDPRFQTAISDLEVQQIEVKGQLWHIRYPIEGEEGRFITVATTRPETMLGDTGVAVHPDDERYRDLVGKHAILPLVGRRIPIVADEYSDPEKGTGAVKITPAHDFNDFEVGKRHGLGAVNIMSPEARLQLAGNDAFLDGLDRGPDLDAVLRLDDLDRFEARKRIVAMLEEHGFLEKVEPHVHMVPHGDRSGVPVEPYLTDQWYVEREAARRARGRGGAGRRDPLRPGELGEDLFPVAREHRALVRLAPAVVGTSDPGLVCARRLGLCRRERGRGAGRGARPGRRQERDDGR